MLWTCSPLTRGSTFLWENGDIQNNNSDIRALHVDKCSFSPVFFSLSFLLQLRKNPITSGQELLGIGQDLQIYRCSSSINPRNSIEAPRCTESGLFLEGTRIARECYFQAMLPHDTCLASTKMSVFKPSFAQRKKRCLHLVYLVT